MKNYVDTIMSQYANSPIIIALIEGINDLVEPDTVLDSFYNKVINLSTATGYGLDVWGRIVGINRTVNTDLANDSYFGFNETGYYSPFNDKPFNGNGGSFTAYPLPDNLYRQLIFIKAYANIIYATAPNINKFLYYIFGGKRAYYLITGVMQAKYVFEFTPTSFERLIIFTLGVLPVPCGISVEYTILDTSGTLGFNGSGLQTFGNGVFKQ